MVCGCCSGALLVAGQASCVGRAAWAALLAAAPAPSCGKGARLNQELCQKGEVKGGQERSVTTRLTLLTTG